MRGVGAKRIFPIGSSTFVFLPIHLSYSFSSLLLFAEIAYRSITYMYFIRQTNIASRSNASMKGRP